jgi:hypothetical protein
MVMAPLAVVTLKNYFARMRDKLPGVGEVLEARPTQVRFIVIS